MRVSAVPVPVSRPVAGEGGWVMPKRRGSQDGPQGTVE